MTVACVIVSGVTALVLVMSAAAKLRRHPVVLATFATCRVPERWLPRLAALEVAAAVGIVVGLWWAPLGIAAAAGAVAYFVGAGLAHVRVGDWTGAATPLVPLLLSVATLVLRVVTA